VTQETARAVGAYTTAATATPQGWVARALSRVTRSEEREYAKDYSKRDSRVHSDIGCRVFQQRNARGVQNQDGRNSEGGASGWRERSSAFNLAKSSERTVTSS